MSLIQDELSRYPTKITNVKITTSMVRKWFDIINSEIFDNELPVWKSNQILIEKMGKSDCAWAYFCGFYYNRKSDGLPHGRLRIHTHFPNMKTFVNVLAHEMVHHWQWTFVNFPGEFDENVIDHDEDFFQWKEKFHEHGLKLSLKIGIE